MIRIPHEAVSTLKWSHSFEESLGNTSVDFQVYHRNQLLLPWCHSSDLRVGPIVKFQPDVSVAGWCFFFFYQGRRQTFQYLGQHLPTMELIFTSAILGEQILTWPWFFKASPSKEWRTPKKSHRPGLSFDGMMVWVEVSHKSIAAWLHLGVRG